MKTVTFETPAAAATSATVTDGSTLVPHATVERLLGDHVKSLGVDVRRGVEVTGFLDLTESTGDEDAGVELHTTAGVLRARWLVAADGGRSPIRKAAGGDATARGSRLADHFHVGRFVLVDRSASGTLSAAAEPWSERLAVVVEAGPADDATPSYRDLTGMLVRPDGVIAWVVVSESQESGAAFVEALERWAGPAPKS